MKTKNLSEPIAEGKLNEIIVTRTRRKNGSLRIQQDFSFCPTLCEQHTAHMSDLNYLIEKYQPDELAAYIAARTQHRVEILGHDFSQEPSLQEASNHVYHAKQNFLNLHEDIRDKFKNATEFYKFIDNPQNQEKMIKLGLLTKKEVAVLTSTTTPKTTSEDKKEEEKK